MTAFYGAPNDTYGINFTLSALFLTDKMLQILGALKIGIVKFALLERLCAISNASFACVKFGRTPFAKTLRAAGFC